MSTQDSATKEINYDDASKFWPERWLTMDKEHYHEFASVPFGYGARKCLGRNVSETMLSLMTFKVLLNSHLHFPMSAHFHPYFTLDKLDKMGYIKICYGAIII